MIIDKILPKTIEELRPVEVDYDINNYKHFNFIVVGSQGSGKTEFVRYVVEEIVKQYGEEECNVYVNNDLDDVLNNWYINAYGKRVHIIIFDDITIKKTDDTVIKEYFRLRHTAKEYSGFNYGIVITIFITHRYHGLKHPELRTTFDLLALKMIPNDRYDINLFKTILGKNNFERLVKAIRRNPYSTFLYFGKTAKHQIVKTPLAKKDYLYTIQLKGITPPIIAEELELKETRNIKDVLMASLTSIVFTLLSVVFITLPVW